MKVLITYKLGEGRDWSHTHTRNYHMEPAEFHLLKTDFLAYLNGEQAALEGACYKYVDGDSHQLKEVVIRFDDILYVECIVKEAVSPTQITAPQHITGSLQPGPPTGPLQSRIASSTPGGGSHQNTPLGSTSGTTEG
jgi:hypothetical protein